MLILTRRVGETLMVGDDVTVTVLGVKGNQVRIGVNAPRDVAVHREEIYERIKRDTGINMTYVQIFNFLIHFYIERANEPKSKWRSLA